MNAIKKGSTDVSRYVLLRDSSDGSPETGYTITDLDLQYVRNRSTAAAKVDATALAAADSAHADNKAIEVGSQGAGLYRIDWPDAAFAAGVDKVVLIVTGSGILPAVEEIQLVDFDPEDGTDLGLTALDATISSRSSHSAADAGSAAATAILATPAQKLATDGSGNVTLKSGTHTGAVIPTTTAVTNDVGITQAAADKVWSSTTRTITGLTTAAIKSIWDQLTSALTAAGSIGKLLVDNINATISSRSSHSAADAGTDAAAKVLATPAQKLVTDGDGRVDASLIKGVDATDQVNAACDTAIETYRLDELFTAALSSQPTAGSLLADLTEDDSDTQRFTQHSLEQAPSGGGGETQLRSGTAQAGGASTITLDSGASAVNDYYKHCILALTGGTGAGQSQIIDGYVGATTVATMAASWATPPDGTSEFVVLPLGTIPGASAPSAAAVADAVWDETLADHDSSGTTGEAVHDVRNEAAGKVGFDHALGDEKVYEDNGSDVRLTRRITEIDADEVAMVPQ